MDKPYWRVIEELHDCHAIHTDYPLLPGDWLVEQGDGTFYKIAPGLGVFGFQLTDEQRATLIPVYVRGK